MHVFLMIDKFFIELDDLLNKCDLTNSERLFLEDLAEFMVYQEKDKSKGPRTILARSIGKLKEGKILIPYKQLIYKYQKQMN